MGKFELVVFDIAGTTVKDKGNVAVAFIDACKKHGYDIGKEDVHKVMGFRKKEAIKILLADFKRDPDSDISEVIEKIHDSFVHNMISFYQNDKTLQPLPNAEQVFYSLKQRGIKVALNTGFTRSITDTILRRLNWRVNDTIDEVIASDEVELGRPHPFMIRTLVDRLKVSSTKQVVKVGDTQVDVQEGRNSGCGLIVSVTTGSYSRQQLESYEPDFVIDNLEELLPLIG